MGDAMKVVWLKPVGIATQAAVLPMECSSKLSYIYGSLSLFRSSEQWKGQVIFETKIWPRD